jgi:hypothetical protein
MKFKEWLKNESPLQYYGYDFHSENEPDEGFLKDKTQSTKNSSDSSDVTDQWDKFSKRDKILISHPKTFKILEDKLRNSSFNFIILLIEQQQNDSSNIRKYESQIQDYLNANNLDVYARRNSIVFAKNSTSGHLLTPWMILHTIGHALFESPHLNASLFYDVSNTLWEIDKLSEQQLKKVFVFKSIRDSNLVNRAELINELVAELLWNGKIRISPKIDSLYPNSEQVSSEEIKSKVLLLEKQLNKCLESVVGKIIYDKLN